MSYLVCFSLISLALIHMCYAFMSSDMSYDYVWSKSSTSTDMIYKISAVWSGGEGALLLWLWFCSLVLTIHVAWERVSSALTRKFHACSQMTVGVVTAVFALVTIRLDLFARTSEIDLLAYPEGRGLALTLQSTEMVIHPPIIFASYAACLALFSVAVAYCVSGEKGWRKAGVLWGRASWILLTIGIALGAVWAYYVAGWGGYWYWDPVETSSLVPWLTVTAFLHTMARRSFKSEFPVMAPLLGMMAFVAVLFAAFVTRTGGLWGSSVHTYGASPGTNIGERLFNLLSSDGTVAGFFLLLIAVLITSVALAYIELRKGVVESRPDRRNMRLADWITDRNNMIASVLLMVTMACVLIVVMVKNTGIPADSNNEELNQKMSVFFAATATLMSICLTWKVVGGQRILYVVAGTFAVSSVLVMVALTRGFMEEVLALCLPPLVLALVSAAVSVVRTDFSNNLRTVAHTLGPRLVHLGIVVALIGFAISTQAQEVPVRGERVDVSVGEGIQVGDIVVVLEDVSVEEREGLEEGYYITTVVTFALEIWKSETKMTDSYALTNVYGGPIPQVGLDRLYADVHIDSALLKDIYLSCDWLDNGSATLHVRILPMMTLVWSGVSLVCLGSMMRMFASGMKE